MSIRCYVVPEEATVPPAPTGKGPKYFAWRFDPDPPALVSSPFQGMAFGLSPAQLVVSNITDADHALLAAQPDVWAAPVDLDGGVAPGEVQAVRDRLEALHIPADWINASFTYRQVLRGIGALCQIAQRHKGLHREPLVPDAASLDERWNQTAQAKRARVQATADSFGYTLTGVSMTSPGRAVYRHLAAQWTQPLRLFNRRAGIDVTL